MSQSSVSTERFPDTSTPEAIQRYMVEISTKLVEDIRRSGKLKQYGEPRDQQVFKSQTFTYPVPGWKLPNGVFDPLNKRKSMHYMEKDRVELKHFSSLLEKRSKAVAALKTGQGKDFMTEHFGELHALSKGWAEEVEEMKKQLAAL